MRLTIRFIDSINNQAVSNLKLLFDENTSNSNSEGLLDLFLEPKQYDFKIFEQDVLVRTFKLNFRIDTFLEIKVNRIFEISAVKLSVNKQVIIAKDNKISIGQNTLQSISLPMSANDPIHLLKTLPGINTSQEMNANLNIRGGNSYNTVFYLDNIPVPNLSHSYGFFSFFDLNTIRQIDYFNNNVSSEYGTRGSSYIKFFLKDPITNKSNSELSINPFFASGNINLKLKKDKLGVFVNYRKSLFEYNYNVLLPMFSDFSDLLIKTKYKFNEKSSLSFIYTNNNDYAFSNVNLGLITKDSLKWKFNALSTQYNLISKSGINHDVSVFMKSQSLAKQSNNRNYNYSNVFNEFNFKYMLKKNISEKYAFAAGIENQVHQNENTIDTLNQLNKNLMIASIFTDQNFRYKNFQFIANLRISNFIELNKFYLEKRLSANYFLKKSKILIEWNNFVNNTHSVVNNVFPVPDDFRFLPSNNLLPQITDEKLIGFNTPFKKSNFQFNAFYRDYKNSLDYRYLNIEKYTTSNNILRMKHYSYGFESFSNINLTDKQSFILSYTYSRSMMQNDSTNLGLLYPTSYDRPHNLNILHSFKFKRFTFTTTFTLQSGRVATVPLFIAYANATPVYSQKNEYRLKPFHKMDIGFQYSFKNKGRIKQFFNFNLYNAYARKNTYAITWALDKNGFYNSIKLYYLSAFPILPSFSYSIKF